MTTQVPNWREEFDEKFDHIVPKILMEGKEALNGVKDFIYSVEQQAVEPFQKILQEIEEGNLDTVGRIERELKAALRKEGGSYNTINHSHCGNQEQPPACGLIEEHKDCCICGELKT